MPKINSTQAFRGQILHFLRAPENSDDLSCYQYFSDGVLVINSGLITAIGPAATVLSQLSPDTKVTDYSNYLIMPGFIDTHIHYVQTEIIASYGKHLLEWLEKYVFPIEEKFKDRAYAEPIATFFLQELFRNGTTTAMVYSSVHAEATDILFTLALKHNMRLLTGKTMMDRNAPSYLLDTPQSAYDDSKHLIEKWHNKQRLSYVVTPRFAPTSSEAQLEVAARLRAEFPTTYLQTHISENKNEVAWVQELFPWSKNYTDVYAHYNLLGPRTMYGHAIFFSDSEFGLFATTGTACAWCPTSNFFLGSGAFAIGQAKQHKVTVGLGTDVGGGSSFSLFRTLDEAYKVATLQNIEFSSLTGLYAITLGNAQALALNDKIGNFTVGKDADFVVLDLYSTPLLAKKTECSKTLSEKLFNLMILGDDRAIKSTYVFGELKYKKEVS